MTKTAKDILDAYKENKSKAKTIENFFKYNKISNDTKIIPDKILELIFKYPLSLYTKKKLIGSIGKVLGDPEFKKKWIQLHNDIKDEVKNNEPVSEKEKEALKVSYDDLVKIKPRAINLENLIYVMLVHIPNTPRLDYATLKRVGARNKNNEENYISYKNGKFTICLNKYKKSTVSGPWCYTIENPYVNNFIRRFINKNSIYINDYLFGKQIKKNTFSKLIDKVFKEIIGVPITINMLRKIKVKHFIIDNPEINKMSINERNEYAKKLNGHSYDTALQYYFKK